uniref:Maestro/Maestro-like HEAT-repeats domain-containing protein n=1 Tax=Nothoprocta perdicaria TaxID=30464 RepID=A0A8C6YSM4_NOTPE
GAGAGQVPGESVAAAASRERGRPCWSPRLTWPNKVVRERKFLRPLLEALVERSRDPISAVRQMAMRGLGNMATGAPTKVRPPFMALLGGLEDIGKAAVATESLVALTKVLGQLEARAMGCTLEDIARSKELRRLTFGLYGALASCASGRRSLFSREAEEAFPSLVLHLQDPSPAVCKVRAPRHPTGSPMVLPEPWWHSLPSSRQTKMVSPIEHCHSSVQTSLSRRKKKCNIFQHGPLTCI